MREVKNMNVEIVDEDHIFVNNKQFISLKRFADAKKDVANEVKLLTDKNKELTEENEALKVLLKNQLDKVIDDNSTETLINKMCVEESDHEWEWASASTVENRFRCKKCGAYRIYPCDYNITTTTLNI